MKRFKNGQKSRLIVCSNSPKIFFVSLFLNLMTLSPQNTTAFNKLLKQIQTKSFTKLLGATCASLRGVKFFCS